MGRTAFHPRSLLEIVVELPVFIIKRKPSHLPCWLLTSPIKTHQYNWYNYWRWTAKPKNPSNLCSVCSQPYILGWKQTKPIFQLFFCVGSRVLISSAYHILIFPGHLVLSCSWPRKYKMFGFGDEEHLFQLCCGIKSNLIYSLGVNGPERVVSAQSNCWNDN